ncbi:MAG: hypothetical protein RBG13Loki_2704 [Promethearchaeota archaeon CR_4]|nr:MAG: hypothetical protein RBG13Loki_2704 [Candidatus Lokiarchaeota archaeon CR_4]
MPIDPKRSNSSWEVGSQFGCKLHTKTSVAFGKYHQYKILRKYIHHSKFPNKSYELVGKSHNLYIGI